MFDIFILLVLSLFLYLGYRRGLLKMLFNLVSFVLSLFLAYLIYPFVSQWLRTTQLYSGLRDYIIRSMALDEFAQSNAHLSPAELFDRLPVPALLRNLLTANHTAETRRLLDVRTIEEYIGGYLAGIAVNILSLLLVFVIVWVLMKLISLALDLIGRLPAIKTLNRVGGLFLGALMGLLTVWILFAVLNFFFLNTDRPQWGEAMEASLFARFFYEYNPIMRMLSNIT
jgi:uncharacterized membrane protein required for colicin V production